MTKANDAARALLAGEHGFRSAFHHAALGKALVGLDGQWLEVNTAMCSLLGYSREELLARTFQDLTHPDDLEADLALTRRLVDGEIGSYQLEKRYVDRAGAVVWVLLGVSLVRDDAGEPLFFISQIQDITERKQAQAALERSTSQLAEAQQLAQIGSWERGADGDLTLSRELERMFAIDPGVGSADEQILACVHPDDRDAVDEGIRLAGAEGLTSLEYRILRPDGEVRWLHGRGEPTYAQDGTLAGRRGTTQDITERKRAEADRDRFREELHQAQKLEAIGRLAGGVAHDFNNMLTAITGYSELLLEKLEPGTTLHHHAAQIRRAAGQASALPRQLLAFSRKQELQPALTDLGAAAEAMADLLRHLIGEQIQIEVTAAAPVLAWVDAAQFEQVLMNLALNARDAMPDGGRLTFESSVVDVDAELAAEHDAAPGEYARVAVVDTGIGIDAQTRARIFEPFFTTKVAGRGFGLGLSSAFGTVSQSGGFIRVDSEPDGGTRFEVHLPVARREAEPSPEVLLAEDEELVRELAVNVLQDAGFRVRVAADGREALARFDEAPEAIGVVVTDLVMPEVDGGALGEHVRERSPSTPIIYMSGYSDRERVEHAGGRFLSKPFSAELLVSAVREAIAEREDANGTPTVSLTRREQEVLMHLAAGLTNDKVAQQLGISAETVQSHVRHAMVKLNASTRTEAVARAIRHALIA